MAGNFSFMQSCRLHSVHEIMQRAEDRSGNQSPVPRILSMKCVNGSLEIRLEGRGVASYEPLIRELPP